MMTGLLRSSHATNPKWREIKMQKLLLARCSVRVMDSPILLLPRTEHRGVINHRLDKILITSQLFCSTNKDVILD